jgi:hypothetical protein
MADEDEKLKKIMQGLLDNGDVAGMAELLYGMRGEQSVGDSIGELKEVGALSKRQVQAMDRNAAQIKNYEDRFVINERGQLVSREDAERRQKWEQKRQEGLADPPAPGPTPEQRATKGREAVDALKAKQGKQAAASAELSEARREKQVAADREARPMAALVNELATNPGGPALGAKENFLQSGAYSKDTGMPTSSVIPGDQRRSDSMGRTYDVVRRDLGDGQFVETKVYRTAEQANQSVATVKTEDGTMKPMGEVTAALAQQNAADAAPSIAETYANASRQQNRGVGGDRNPSTDIIAGLTATADPRIVANKTVNKKSKEELEREKRIKAMTQGMFPSNTRRATAV